MRPTGWLLEFARRPAPQAEAARANYNSNVLCSKSLSGAGEDEAGEGFIVKVQIYRIDVLFWLAFHDPINKKPLTNPHPYIVLKIQ